MKPKDNKDKRISIRLTDNEMNSLETKASLYGLNKSAFTRRTILHSKSPIHKFDKDIVVQISRIGANLNQIARHANTTKSIDAIALKNIMKINSSINSLLDKDKKC
ncbi:plasmid mobilization protein [Campylobacter sp. RM16192]|uniref:plasmid mobilization protein n=1 Tax=Campylobacter sp. RM16192 TaxID=1660080 RepID=UPI00145115CE|nr:plasmid mobilization relaxosome protein MobC [Campylobacter sp. RM16192]QCD51755.1 putative mobilization protein [Campylobacter sp. RM16192]